MHSGPESLESWPKFLLYWYCLKHIFNKTKVKISTISIKFNETNVTEKELIYSLSVLLLYSESLGFITVAEVLALAQDVSEGGASKRARTAEGSDPLDFFGSSLNEEITGLDVNISLALNPHWSILSITFLYNVL